MRNLCWWPHWLAGLLHAIETLCCHAMPLTPSCRVPSSNSQAAVLQAGASPGVVLQDDEVVAVVIKAIAHAAYVQCRNVLLGKARKDVTAAAMG